MSERTPHSSGGTENLMLALAAGGFLVNFWAWALISPLAAGYRGEPDLSPFQQSLLVALPVLVGSLGRIPVGALTDRFGARLMFPVVSGLTILPVLFVVSPGTPMAGCCSVGSSSASAERHSRWAFRS